MRKNRRLKWLWIFLSGWISFIASVCYAKTLDLDIKGSVETAYDDNITYRKTDQKEGLVSNVLLGLGLTHEGKTHRLDFETNIVRHIFFNESEFDNTSEDLRFNFIKDLSEYDRIKIEDSFSHAEEARNFEDAFGRTSGRYSSYKNFTGATVIHEFSEQLSMDVHYLNYYDNYSRQDQSDTVLHRAGAVGSYMYDSATTFSLGYDYYRRLFENGGDSTVNSLTTGARRFLTQQLYLDVGIGPDFIRSFDDQNYVKPHYNAALTNQADENTQFTLSYNRQYTTTASTQDLFNSWRTALSMNRRLNDRLDILLSAFYGSGTYLGINVTEKLQGVNAELNYDLTEFTKAGIGYSYTDSESDIESNEYRRNYTYCKLGFVF